MKPHRQLIPRLAPIDRAAGIRDQFTALIVNLNHHPSFHRTLAGKESDTKGVCRFFADPAFSQVRMIWIDASELEGQRLVFRLGLSPTLRRHLNVGSTAPLNFGVEVAFGDGEPVSELDCRIPDAALLHGRDKIQYVAARLAGETVESVLGEVDMKRILPVAFVNWTAPPQLAATFPQPVDLVVIEQHLHAADRLYRFEIYPVVLHYHLLESWWLKYI